MTLTTTTHLNFRGTARQALEFYRTVFGGRLVLATYGDFGMPRDIPGADKIVFGQVESENGFRVMAYDIPGQDDTLNDDTLNHDALNHDALNHDALNHDTASALTAGSTHRENGTTVTDRTFFQSLRAGALDEIAGYWETLSQGGTVIEPLAASAWSPGFGMLTDRFGVTWVLDVRATIAG